MVHVQKITLVAYALHDGECSVCTYMYRIGCNQEWVMHLYASH